MAVSKIPLGMNARNFLYLKRHNKTRAKGIADDKLATKKLLLEHDIPTPCLLDAFTTYGEARSYTGWEKLPDAFVLKPAHGFQGSGIHIVSKWDGSAGVNEKGETVTRKTIEAYIFDILDGAHSLHNLPDQAFCEERLIVPSGFKRLGKGGVSDIRVVVCHKVPIMAMLRLPTGESGRKANLHLGALGIGIDMRTGITTGAVQYDEDVMYVPESRTKAHGIKIPYWEDLLLIATRAQEASGLGYAGIDIVIDERRGPLVLEINARPGLSIQLANGSSLRTRLERVAEIDVQSPKKGVELAQRLFAEPELSDIPTEQHILHIVEKVTLFGPKKRKTVLAKIDSGAYRTSIDETLVKELGFEETKERVYVTAGSGAQMRQTAHIRFRLRGKTIGSVASFIDRSHMRFPMIIGRRDMQGFLIDPSAYEPHVQ